MAQLLVVMSAKTEPFFFRLGGATIQLVGIAGPRSNESLLSPPILLGSINFG